LLTEGDIEVRRKLKECLTLAFIFLVFESKFALEKKKRLQRIDFKDNKNSGGIVNGNRIWNEKSFEQLERIGML
jgi:hypothetical protein